MPGKRVKRGQALMRIDPTDLRLAMRAHEEAVAAAKARARQTADDEARYRDLVAGGAVSASAYDKVKAAAEAARAELNAAEAQADVARNETSYAVLFADADGVVVETLAEPGQVVDAGQVVVRVAHAGSREAVIELPETLRPAIGSTGRATLYGSGLTGAAKLRQLSNAANRQTRTFEARYVLEGRLADAPLGSTMLSRSRPSKSPTAGLPQRCRYRSARFSIQARAQAYGSSKAKRLGSRGVPCKSPASATKRLRSSANSKAGDRVVALGAHLLREGEHVRLVQSEVVLSSAVNGGAAQ